MAAGTSKFTAAWRALLLGLLAALVAMAGHAAGLDRRLEHLALDARFRHLPTIEPGDRIVHVDLDDKSLEQVGRWPWPRRRLAQLVEVLSACGAKAVALDIILPYPQEPRYVNAGATDLYLADQTALLNEVPPVLVLDDVELGEVLAAHRNVFLSMHVDIAGERAEKERDSALAVLSAAVATRPALDRRTARAELVLASHWVEELMVPAKEKAFQERIGRMLVEEPDLSFQRAAADLLGQADSRTEDFDIARRVYLRQRALRALGRLAMPESFARDAPARQGTVTPPLVTLASVIAHTGFVTVTPDDDGVVRRIPLLVRTESGVYPQLALALAADALQGEHGGLVAAFSGGRLVIRCGDGFTRAIPVDGDGNMLINWCRTGGGWLAGKHLSAVAAADVWQAREQLGYNRNLRRLACIKMAQLLRDPQATSEDANPLLKLIKQEQDDWQELEKLRVARQSALLFDPAGAGPWPATGSARPASAPSVDRALAPPAEASGGRMAELSARLADLDGRIDQQCAALLGDVDFALSQAPPEGDGAQQRQFHELKRLRELVESVQRGNGRIQARLQDATERLRQEVGGRIVLVGSTATGAADFVPTPLHQRTPGVVVHANILNTILSGRFVHTQGGFLSAVLVLLAGALIALITSTRGPIESALLLLTAIGVYAVIDGAVWAVWTYWLVAVAPVLAMLLVFTTVTVYRQLTEERQRRQITSTFKRYLSPAMVDQLVQDPTQANLGGQRRSVSCFFSDLAGFTSISEKLGPERTVNLLNRFLDGVDEVLQGRYNGTLSKYEGDGIFAFFGAPIARDDHAALALAAALDCQALMPQFNLQMHADGLLPEGTPLVMRIGITSGEVFVGNMGSTQKIAYTAIGPLVNLASRLETANKFFGTQMLVSQDAWQAGANGALGRPLGKILVVGTTEPVFVWEPLARQADANAELARLAEVFAAGVEAFAQSRFDQALAGFRDVLKLRDDPAARVYIRLCEQALADPTLRAEFDGVIRLTEK